MNWIKKLKQSQLYASVRELKVIAVIYLDIVSKHYFKFSFPNLQEFIYIYREIFLWKEYEFFTNKKNPMIIDCGSHIGISILYFKKLYPHARIIGFEPSPKTFKFLQKNLRQNNIHGVTLMNVALAGKKGSIPFYTAKNIHGRWAWSDSAIKHNEYDERYYQTIHVPTVKLSSYINQPIDLIKIDVEWMELEVLHEIEKKLHLVREIIFDFHGSKDNHIEKLTKILKNHNFRYVIYQGRIGGVGKQVTEKEVKKTKPTYSLIVHAKLYHLSSGLDYDAAQQGFEPR